MKKRILLTTINCLLAMLLVACGSNNSAENLQNTVSTESSQSENEFEENKEEDPSPSPYEEAYEEPIADTSVEISDDKYTYVLGSNDEFNGYNYEAKNVFGFNFDIEGYEKSNSMGSSVGDDPDTYVTKSYTLSAKDNPSRYLLVEFTDIMTPYTKEINLMKSFLETNTIPAPVSEDEKIISMELKDTLDTIYGTVSILYTVMENRISESEFSYRGYETAFIEANNYEIVIMYSYINMDSAPEYEGFLIENLPTMLQEK